MSNSREITETSVKCSVANTGMEHLQQRCRKELEDSGMQITRKRQTAWTVIFSMMMARGENEEWRIRKRCQVQLPGMHRGPDL